MASNTVIFDMNDANVDQCLLEDVRVLPGLNGMGADLLMAGYEHVVRDVKVARAGQIDIAASDSILTDCDFLNGDNLTRVVTVSGDNNRLDGITIDYNNSGAEAILVSGDDNILTGIQTPELTEGVGGAGGIPRTGIHITGDRNIVTTFNLLVATAADNTYDGVLVDSGAANNLICTGIIRGNGTQDPRYGVNIAAGAGTGNVVCHIIAPDAQTATVNGSYLDELVFDFSSPKNHSGALSGTYRKIAPWDFEVIESVFSSEPAQSGGTAVADVNINGTSIHSTGHPTIAAGQTSSGWVAPDGTTTGGSKGDAIQGDIDSTTTTGDFVLSVKIGRVS